MSAFAKEWKVSRYVVSDVGHYWFYQAIKPLRLKADSAACGEEWRSLDCGNELNYPALLEGGGGGRGGKKNLIQKEIDKR